jgi:hypothetical protein
MCLENLQWDAPGHISCRVVAFRSVQLAVPGNFRNDV